MQFILHHDVQEFADQVMGLLNRQEIQNNLLIHNINNGLAHKNQEAGGLFMATVRDAEGAILLTAVRTPPHALVFYETGNQANDGALDCLARGLVEAAIPIDVFAAERDLASRFASLYSSRSKKAFYIHQNLVLYLLEHVHAPPAPSGHFRPAGRQDIFYLPYWLADFVPACHIGEYNLEQGIKNANQMIQNGTGFIWEDGVPVSLAAHVRRTDHCAIIGAVYTPPFVRSQGYSTACVAALSAKLLADGWQSCALYADCANPWSNRVYQKIGYQQVLFYDEYRMVSEQVAPPEPAGNPTPSGHV
jgi:uncharacterized protein